MTAMDSPDIRELLERVRIGRNAEAFLRTDLGGSMIERMSRLRRDALARLEDVDPSDSRAVMVAQNEARIPLLVVQAIDDAIEEGRLAEGVLTDPAE